MNIGGPKEDMPSTMSRPDMQLYFSEVSGDIHGPLHFAPDEPVEQILQRLEGDTSRSCCVDNKTNAWLAHVEILTNCGQLLELYRTLDDYPASDGDNLTVILVPDEDTSSDDAVGDMEEVD